MFELIVVDAVRAETAAVDIIKTNSPKVTARVIFDFFISF
jgi:hypothetical protein